MICISTDFRDTYLDDSLTHPNKIKYDNKIRAFKKCVKLVSNAVVCSYFRSIDPEDISRIIRDAASRIFEKDIWSSPNETTYMMDFLHGLSCIISDYKIGLTTGADDSYVLVRYSHGEESTKYVYSYDNNYDAFLEETISGIFDRYLFALNSHM